MDGVADGSVVAARATLRLGARLRLGCVRLAGSGSPLSGGRRGRRPGRQWPDAFGRRPRGVRCSVAGVATACARRWRARHRSAGTTAACVPACRRDLLGRGVLGRLGWRGADPIGKCLGKPPVTGVHPGHDGRVVPQRLLDSLGLDGGLVVHPVRSHRPRPQGAALTVGDGGGLDRVLLALAGHKRPPAGPDGPGPADLGLGAVDAQFDPVGGGVGEHVGQGAQPHPAGRAPRSRAPPAATGPRRPRG